MCIGDTHAHTRPFVNGTLVLENVASVGSLNPLPVELSSKVLFMSEELTPGHLSRPWLWASQVRTYFQSLSVYWFMRDSSFVLNQSSGTTTSPGNSHSQDPTGHKSLSIPGNKELRGQLSMGGPASSVVLKDSHTPLKVGQE